MPKKICSNGLINMEPRIREEPIFAASREVVVQYYTQSAGKRNQAILKIKCRCSHLHIFEKAANIPIKSRYCCKCDSPVIVYYNAT